MSFDFRKDADFPKHFDLEAEEFDRKKERENRQAALIFAILIALLAGTGIVLLAVSNRQPGPSELHDCATVESETARLACYDELSRRRAMPFKGAPPQELGGQK